MGGEGGSHYAPKQDVRSQGEYQGHLHRREPNRVAGIESQSSRGLRKVFMGEGNLRCQSLSSVRKEKTRRTLG